MRVSERDAEFRAFYLAEALKLKRLALLLSGDPAASEDLAQEALLRAYRAWPRIRKAEAGAYVTKILVNQFRNAHRRRLLEIRRRPAPQPDTPSVEQSVAETLRIAQAIEHLSPVGRVVVVLRFYEDMTEADIARILDRPLNTVKSDLRRALQRLRTELNEGVSA
jgi:RNA polymerase sigma-70 factor (sigma-E family)